MDFRRFLDVKSEKAIARELTRHDIPPCSGERWTGPKVSRILTETKITSEISSTIANRRSLGGIRVCNPQPLGTEATAILNRLLRWTISSQRRRLSQNAGWMA